MNIRPLYNGHKPRQPEQLTRSPSIIRRKEERGEI